MLDLAPQHKLGLALNNPVLNASGILGFAGEARGVVELAQLGAFVTNAVTYTARTPARGPNAELLPEGWLIHTGLPNPGVRAAVKRWDKDWRKLGPPVIVHLAATTPTDVARSVEILEKAQGIVGLEVGVRDDVSPSETLALLREARGHWPVIARLPLANALPLCEAALKAGVAALTLGGPPRHTTPSGHVGRWYGPAQFEITLQTLQAAHTQLGADAPPLIAAGGIFTLAQAQTLLAAGATALQLDAVLWQTPGVVAQWAAALQDRPG